MKRISQPGIKLLAEENYAFAVILKMHCEQQRQPNPFVLFSDCD